MGGDIGVIAPENTVGAVRAAIAYGVDFIETDPRPSKDGVFVNVHDADVDRVTTGTGNVDQMTVDELKALTLETAKYEGDWSCERIATVEEILLAAKGRIHVLLDANKTSDVAGLVKLVQTTGTLDWAIFDTGSPDKIEEALALEPALKTMIRVETEAELDDQLTRFAAHPPVIVEIHGAGLPKTLAPLVHARKNRVLFDTFGVDISVGITGDVSGYANAYGDGVDIVQTDRADLVLGYLGR
jgi:glycerophosphoryl diester phosphodiesterase